VATRRPPAVARVLERVTKTAREHEMFIPGDIVLVSVSGGPDSVCLLYSLWYLRRLFRIRLDVLHFDHRLRDRSGDDATYVQRVCIRLGLACHLRAAEEAPPRGASVEAWASVARANAANSVRREIGAGVVAEGHTLDDQAETVLLNLVRGTGLEGMTGIAPRLGDRPGSVKVQPLIDLERPQIEAFCGALHLRPRVDPTNTNRRLLRNAIRLDVLPELERATGRSAKASIVRTAGLLREDRSELEAESARLFRTIVSEERSGLWFDAETLAGLSPALAGRVVRLAVYRAMSGDWAAPWSREAIDAIVDLAAGRPGRKRDLPGGRRARRTRTHVVVER
jgi:tRNA(Ile)-lysidine synthase